jgi:hypothetical protein
MYLFETGTKVKIWFSIQFRLEARRAARQVSYVAVNSYSSSSTQQAACSYSQRCALLGTACCLWGTERVPWYGHGGTGVLTECAQGGVWVVCTGRCVELFTCLWHCSYIQGIPHYTSVTPLNMVGGDHCFGGKREHVRKKVTKVKMKWWFAYCNL